ncbi:armadillo-type protein [Schizothecium vesticola]|uniref:Armadillo-type protein n=1 Tax=Schizothecium vesticola TaxID=314040 RepID=A0AA40EKB3_9PEZI|nr:armadillo-type protein [Schizothecium vesticola]
MDDFFRNQQSPRGEPQMGAFTATTRNGPQPQLPRRFTTDSGRVPTLSSITAQRGPEPQDFASTTTLHKVQLLEKKRMDYERLREHKRRFEAEIHKLDAQQRAEERELALMQEDLNGGRYAGHQSEPTTPPEYRETSAGFPTMFSRPNRYSTSSLTSPPGLFNRPARSGSVLTSPQAGIVQARFAFDDHPSRSVPGSRRNSDEDEKEEAVRQDPTSHRSTNALNRYSMPVTRSRTYLDIGLEDSNNTTGFLFGDEDSTTEARPAPANNPDSFPARPHNHSTTSTALDLAQAQNTTPDSVSTNGWNGVSKHRSQASMSKMGSSHNGAASPPEASAIRSRPSSIRHSIDGVKFFQDASSSTAPDTTAVVSTAPSHSMATPPKLQQSYSTSDIPTVKTSNVNLGANNHAQQHLHNHNASLGRIPAGAMANRHSRELSSDANAHSGRDNGNFPNIGSALHANAAPFGPNHHPHSSTAVGPGAYNNLPMMMQSLAIAGNPQGPPVYPQAYNGYNPGFPQAQRHQPQDSQARVIQSRRQVENEAMARFNNLPLEHVVGSIYSLCKDQHGCRYLQKQLENRIPEQIHMIWLETNQHVVELMTDPFGNYLCQKLLEYCTDDERTVLIQNAAKDMVRIALNQHGTRALQKMIEHVNTSVQIKLIIDALRHKVVELIQDLNGNHVIQKCLNKLEAADASFIFEAVGIHCVDVGTHRHGCCVLQRCIDHAEGNQKVWLIRMITQNSVSLVQDPFGNYVVQYIIDLDDDVFTEPVVEQFRGRIPMLSRHKFSSNVVEKCLRCASEKCKDMIVEELLSSDILSLLRDNFANYVVQTALEYATPAMKIRLVEIVRPALASIRNTPYGRRIQAKVQAYDNRSSSASHTIAAGGLQLPAMLDATGGQATIIPGGRRIPNGQALSGPQSINGPQNTITGTNGPHVTNGPHGTNGSGYSAAASTVAVQMPVQQGFPLAPRASALRAASSRGESDKTNWF